MIIRWFPGVLCSGGRALG